MRTELSSDSRRSLNRFLLRLILFSAVTTGYIGLVLAFNYSLHRRLPVPVPRVAMLLAGPSHMLYGVEADSFQHAINIAQPAESYAITFWKLKKILPAARPDTLLLSFDPSHLSPTAESLYSSGTYARASFRRYHAVIDLPQLTREFDVDYLVLAKTYVKYMGVVPGLNDYAYLSSERTGFDMSDLSDSERAVARHYPPESSAPRASSSQLRYLDSILTMCEEYGVLPIVIAPPLHATYRAGIPPRIQRTFLEVVAEFRRRGVAVFDRTAAVYPDDYFKDPDHLNRRGCGAFTRDVKGFLRTLPG